MSYCRVVREAPNLTFNDLAKQTNDALTNLNVKFLEFWGVKNNEELSTVVQAHSKDYADKLQNVIGQLSAEVYSCKKYKLRVCFNFFLSIILVRPSPMPENSMAFSSPFQIN